MLLTIQPTFAAGKRARSQCREHVGAAKRAKALPDVCPLYASDPRVRLGAFDTYDIAL
jgi:hypothetical protein